MQTDKQLLIFDLDGTLIDSVPDICLAVNDAFAQLKYPPLTEAQVRSFVGNGSVKLIERALRSIDADTGQALTQAHTLFLQSYATINITHTKPYDGVNTGLAQLQARYTLALVTNKPVQFVPTILEAFGWTTHFALVLGGDSLAKKKPDPMPLQHVCQRLGFHVKQSYMIGDSKNDILAGQNANMQTIGLSYGYNHNCDISDFQPDKTFDDFQSMVAFLLDKKSKS